jgi:hypothetical protein
MKKAFKVVFFALSVLLCLPVYSQAWSGILPTSRATNWSGAGVPGGIPSGTWTQSGTTISPASGDMTSTIQAALDVCGLNHYVQLATGTFLLDGYVTIHSNCELRGMGADKTILNAAGSNVGMSVVNLGDVTSGDNPNSASLPDKTLAVSITGGNTQGSTSITVSNASNIAVGKFLLINQLNDGTIVSNTGSNSGGGVCTWCGYSPGNRAQGQISKVISVSGTTIGIYPGLFVAYTLTPWAIPFSMNQSSGLKDLQIYANGSGGIDYIDMNLGKNSTDGTYTIAADSGTGVIQIVVSGGTVTSTSVVTPGLYQTSALPTFTAPSGLGTGAAITLVVLHAYTGNVFLNLCAYCWVSGIEGNYTDANQVDQDVIFQSEVVDSYFTNAFYHIDEEYDSEVSLRSYSTLSLIQNNIMERLHKSIQIDWGAAGNVIAYNFTTGEYDNASGYTKQGVMETIDIHGAHPQYNLFEGNVTAEIGPDGTHGSTANNTYFRNWAVGTTLSCNPPLGRAFVTCTPLGHQQDGTANGWWGFMESTAFEFDYSTSYINLIGNVAGSTEMENLTGYFSGGSVFTVTPVGALFYPATRDIENYSYGYNFGYHDKGSDGTGGDGSTTTYSTLFWHGDYNDVTKTVMRWEDGVTHTLPSSFYMSSKPSWWIAGLAYPAIGPDVTSGAGASGHASYIPAQYCFYKMIGGNQGGAGSPLIFNADACYKSGSFASIANLPFRGMTFR